MGRLDLEREREQNSKIDNQIGSFKKTKTLVPVETI